MAFELHNRRSNSASYQQLDDNAGKVHPLPPKPPPNLFRRWLWESLAAFVALGSMGAVIVILLVMQDEPEDSWTFYFKITSTVAGFITAVKSLSLLIVGTSLSQRKWSHFEQRPSRLGDFDVFDEASRGPVGAIHLLWRLRTRWSFTALGAIITIATVSVDSLAQQVIDTEIRDMLQNSKGNETSFWVAESYITGAEYRPGISSLLDPKPSTVDAVMQRAIYRGFFAIESNVPFDCPSQCGWEESYTTLAVESKCEDVTLSAFAESKQFPTTSGPNPSSGMIRFQTPGGLLPAYNVSFTAWATTISVVAKLTYSIPGSHTSQGASFEPDFARIGVFRLKGPEREGSMRNNGIELSKLSPDHADVYECQLGLRAFEHSDIRVNASKITIGRTVVHNLDPGVLTEGIIVFSTPGLPTFRVSPPDLAAVANFLSSSSFSGTVYDGESAPKYHEGLEDHEMSQGLAPWLIDADLNRTFANIALSMTHQLQSGTSPNVVAKAGKNIAAVPYVVVRWQFLVVPLVIVGAAVLFLGITMWGTRRNTLWKSSAVAVLYHDLEQPQSASEAVLRSRVRDEKDLESSAKRIQVRYER